MPSVPLALLADHAVAHTDDLKLYVLGGGIRSMAFFAFPAKVPRLALALGLEFSADELRAPPHNLRIEASGPGQEPPVKPLSASFTVTRDVLHPDQPVYFHVVYNLEDITLPAEGEYVFSVFVDEQLAKQVPLRAQQAAGPLPAELESQILLNEGYQAFASGDLAAAERLFRDVATRFPAEAGGHNNLGFLLLSRGRADAALAAFVTARQLEYVHPELLDVNMGCAHYLAGDFVSASIFFEQCLSSRGFRGPQAMLFAIQESRLFPVPLNSAAEYVSLVMLNGAWSALRTGDRVMALRYVEGAQAGSLGRREDESGRNFAQSVEEVKEQLARPPTAS